MIGEGTSDHNDTVDIVFQSVQRNRQVPNAEGVLVWEQYMDDLSLWCKTLTVSSNKLAQVIYEMMEFARDLQRAKQNMCKEKADEWIAEGMLIIESVKKSLDSKSSESVVNKDNKQSTLIDKINKNSVEKIYTMKDKAKGSIFDSILGKDVERDSE